MNLPYRHVAAAAAGLCTALAAAAASPGSTGSTAPLVTPSLSGSTAAPVYPRVERGTDVDDYHGTRVADPYRALEVADAPATRRFVAEQNALAQPWLEAIPQRAWIKSRLEALWNYERVGVPRKEGGRYFFLRNDGLQNQSVLYWTDALEATPHVLIDPNTRRADATVAIARFEPSPDGKILAYSLSDGGTDWEVWRFRRVDDGVDLPDELRFTKFWELSWARDGSGVWYSRYAQRPVAAGAAGARAHDPRAGDPHGNDRQGDGPRGDDARGDDPQGDGQHHDDPRGDDQSQPVVHFHRLGEPQSADRPVYAVEGHPTRAPSARVTDDGRWLVVTLFDG